MVDSIPTEQLALQIITPGHYEIRKVPVPTPASGQVLVKVECAPINPSDTYFLAGMYGGNDEGVLNIQYPFTPGWEGSGTVVRNGGGLMGWRLVGKRVSISKCQEPDNKVSIGGCY